MFQGIKKLLRMIYLGATRVSEIFLGEMMDPIIHIGNYKTYPEGTTSTALTNMRVIYSSGDMINAAGTNYAYIACDLVTYLDGQEYSRGTVYITSNLTTSGSSSIWYSQSGGMIRAYSRGRTTGNTRTSQWTGYYNGYPVNSSVTVSQQYNELVYSAGEITAVSLNGNTGRTDTDFASKTLGVPSIAGYRNASWTSGESDHLSDPNYWNILNNNPEWITINSSTGMLSISNNGTGSGRTGSFTVSDKLYNTTPYTYVIYQSASEVPSEYVLTFDRYTVNLSAQTTQFWLDVTSTKDGSPLEITGQMVTISQSTTPGYGPISNLRLSTISNRGNGVYRLLFACSSNSSGDPGRASIKVEQTDGGSIKNTKYCQVNQSGATISIQGIDVVAQSGNWVIGTIDIATGSTPTNFTTRAMVVAKSTANNSDATVNITQLVWQKQSGPLAAPTAYTENSLTFTIPAGTTVSYIPLGGSYTTYYGSNVKNTSQGEVTPAIGVQINYITGFVVSE